MEYRELKEMEMKRAEAVIEALNTSKDPYVVYKTSRPITQQFAAPEWWFLWIRSFLLRSLSSLS